MTFPNPPVATVRVCRITQRDKHSGGTGTRSKLLLLVVALSPLTMSIW
jgi:hypothetical protein